MMMVTPADGDEQQEMVEEHCSALWNQIKDAGVLLGGAELSDELLEHLQSEEDHLNAEVHSLAQKSEALAANAQLRLCSVHTALEGLKRKKRDLDESEQMGEGYSDQHLQQQMVTQFRRWLHHMETELGRIKTRIPHFRHNMGSLLELEQEQKALQERIETEGKAKQQQLRTSSNSQHRHQRRHSSSEEQQLEHRYLELWLASLESLELIHHFEALLHQHKYLSQSELSSEEEEGPNPKRRKTDQEEEEEAQMLEKYMVNNTDEITTCPEGITTGQQQQLTDIGYSSGDQTSVASGDGQQLHHSEHQQPLAVDEHFVLTANNELEKSFYRTVPLDVNGQTDLDTDEGQWPRSSYWAQRFLDEVGKAGGAGSPIELTDSLIVHVDTPECREKLNEFEEVMDLLSNEHSQQTMVRCSFVPCSEDECDSQSTEDEGGFMPRKKTEERMVSQLSTRKRPRALAVSSPRANRIPVNGRRRKWATVRKTRSSIDGLKDATNWAGWPSFSSDYEWDDEYGGGRHAHPQKQQGVPMARKKTLSAFRDELRLAATESGSVSVRLRELLALVDQSVGGVDSAALLLAELNATLGALSRLCAQLELKTEGQKEHFQKDINAELMLCHERMNALETTCNHLALLLGTHLDGAGNIGNSEHDNIGKKCTDDNEYLAQFAVECNRIRAELQKLKIRFGERFVFCSIQLNSTVPKEEEDKENRVTAERQQSTADMSVQTTVAYADRGVAQQKSFWRSYLLLCILGLLASFGTLLVVTSRDGTDWRWTFGPQLHYENGAPPF